MNSPSNTQHTIKHRDTPNDEIYTPKGLVKLHLEELDPYMGKLHNILDPCCGDGAYGREIDHFNYPFMGLDIKNGKDFFDFELEDFDPDLKDYWKERYWEEPDETVVDIIVSNLPFSLTDKFLEKSVSLNPSVISYLMPMYALTPKRMEFMEKNGYSLKKVKQFKWYCCMGMCCFATWVENEFADMIHTQGGGDLIVNNFTEFTFDRRVWYKIEDWEKKKNKDRLDVFKKAASEGKKKHKKKWWCKQQELISRQHYDTFVCAHKQKFSDDMFKWDFKNKKYYYWETFYTGTIRDICKGYEKLGLDYYKIWKRKYNIQAINVV